MEKQEFTVTGPGEYRARSGKKVTIVSVAGPETHPFLDSTGLSYQLSGRYLYDADVSQIDIVGPWIEPETAGESAAIEPEKTVYDYARETIERLSARVEPAAERPAFAGGDFAPEHLAESMLEFENRFISPMVEQLAEDEMDAEEEPTDYRECAEVLAAALRNMIGSLDGVVSVKTGDAVTLARIALDGFAP